MHRCETCGAEYVSPMAIIYHIVTRGHVGHLAFIPQTAAELRGYMIDEFGVNENELSRMNDEGCPHD